MFEIIYYNSFTHLDVELIIIQIRKEFSIVMSITRAFSLLLFEYTLKIENIINNHTNASVKRICLSQ